MIRTGIFDELILVEMHEDIEMRNIYINRISVFEKPSINCNLLAQIG